MHKALGFIPTTAKKKDFKHKNFKFMQLSGCGEAVSQSFVTIIVFKSSWNLFPSPSFCENLPPQK
jgi:hypothetical protein